MLIIIQLTKVNWSIHAKMMNTIEFIQPDYNGEVMVSL